MKVSNKAHRVMTIVAAILMLLGMLFSGASTVITLIGNASMGVTGGSYILSTVIRLLIMLLVEALLVTALFRGKKDVLSGILFLAVALIGLVQDIIARVISIVSISMADMGSNEAMLVSIQTSTTILLIVGVIVLAVRLLLAFECFKPGAVSGSVMKWVLILLPVVATVLATAAGGIQRAGMFDQMEMGTYIAAVLLPGVLTFIGNVPSILMAVAFAIPVYEKQTLT